MGFIFNRALDYRGRTWVFIMIIPLAHLTSLCLDVGASVIEIASLGSSSAFSQVKEIYV